MIEIMPPISRPELVWDSTGALHSLVPHPQVTREGEVAAIIVNRDRPDLVGELVDQLAAMNGPCVMDVYVVEMGSDPQNLSPYCTLRYDDADFRGKCYGHNVGLRLARASARYRYYWILMNDIRFADPESLNRLIGIADSVPELAIISPTELDSRYPGSRPAPGADYHLISTCDYLGFLMKTEAVEQVGFLNPDFKYSWGAIHELSYKLHCAGRRLAYCDCVTMKHLGGTTYGQTRNTVSRAEYQKSAKAFCAEYFRRTYGEDWDRQFSSVLPPGIRHDTFRIHRRLFEGNHEHGSLARFVKRLRGMLR